MMSVIVEDMQPTDPSERFLLFAKGSDTRMFKLNVTETGVGVDSKEVVDAQTALIAATKVQLVEMAEDGLRTLCFAYRVIPADVLEPWLDRYEAVSARWGREGSGGWDWCAACSRAAVRGGR